MDQTSPPTTPTLNSQPPSAAAPAPIIVPKAFKYPEMYMSPTDSIMSPVSKGILARTRSNKKKSSLPLQNSSTTKEQQHKTGDSKFGDMGALEF